MLTLLQLPYFLSRLPEAMTVMAGYLYVIFGVLEEVFISCGNGHSPNWQDFDLYIAICVGIQLHRE